MKFSKTAWLKAFSGLSVNLSAGWFGAVLVFPNFSSIKNYADVLVLFYNLVFGTLFLVLTALFERNLEK